MAERIRKQARIEPQRLHTHALAGSGFAAAMETKGAAPVAEVLPPKAAEPQRVHVEYHGLRRVPHANAGGERAVAQIPILGRRCRILRSEAAQFPE